MKDKNNKAVEIIDEFGFDSAFYKRAVVFMDLLYDYFKVDVEGINTIPTKEPLIFVANHTGFIPLDALTIQHAIYRSLNIISRPLLEDFIMSLPFASSWLTKMGFARASRSHALKLLKRGYWVITFPEGVKGLEKTFAERCSVKRFGRGGVIKLSLLSGAKVVPVAISGPGAAYPMIFRLNSLGRFFGVPFIPITPTFPILGPLGFIPFRTKFNVKFGQPIDPSKYFTPGVKEEPMILQLNEEIRNRIREMLLSIKDKREKA